MAELQLCVFCVQTYNSNFFDSINDGLQFSVEFQQNITFGCCRHFWRGQKVNSRHWNGDNGDPITVEIDESKFFHRKYHRGQWNQGHCVFGGTERGSGKCFLVEVPDRTAATLQAKIRQYILPGSHIIWDGWAAYANVCAIGGGIYICIWALDWYQNQCPWMLLNGVMADFVLLCYNQPLSKFKCSVIMTYYQSKLTKCLNRLRILFCRFWKLFRCNTVSISGENGECRMSWQDFGVGA